MQVSDEIKSRLDIVDVIREYVNLKPAGSNFSALSPFNREKTPSFMVSPEKQIWHCFSSGKGGDVITFIMEMEGVSFVEALRILAPKAGVTLQKQDPQKASKRNKLLDITQIAVNFYHKNLMESDVAEPARKYLRERGLTDDTLIDWQIGFSPDSWDDLVGVLMRRGYKEEDIVAAGLANRRKQGSGIYNRFRNRIMFPINDLYGNTVAFSARVRPDKEEEEVLGKYINSPQTFIYDKSGIIFGLDKAKTEIRNEDLAVVVEGQMDVITAHQAGFKNVVASSGTALTGEQLRMLKRYSSNITLAFDMDQAGQMAVDRAVREAFPLEMNVKIMTLSSGKDPDEVIRRDPQEWTKAVSESKHVMEHYFDKITSETDIENIDGKKEAIKRLLPIISLVANRVEQDHWIKKLSERLNVSENALRETLVQNAKQTAPRSRQSKDEEEAKTSQASNSAQEKSREEKLSEELLALVMRFPEFLEYVVSKAGLDHIFGSEPKAFYKNLILYYNEKTSKQENSSLNYEDLKEFFQEKFGQSKTETDDLGNNQLKLLNKLVILGEKEYYHLERDQAKSEMAKILIELKRSYIIKRMREVERTIAEAEKEGEKDKVEELMKELRKLSQELSELK